MFDIGFWELLLIGIVSLVVLGPERMPGAIRSTIKTVKDIKNVANGFKQEVNHQLKVSELHEHLRQAEQAGMNEIGNDVKRSVEELKAAAASVQEPYKKQAAASPTPAKPAQISSEPSSDTANSSDMSANGASANGSSDNDARK